MLVEIILIIGIAVAAIFAIRYIVKTHKRDGCVGCSMAKQCHQNPEVCPLDDEDENTKEQP